MSLFQNFLKFLSEHWYIYEMVLLAQNRAFWLKENPMKNSLGSTQL